MTNIAEQPWLLLIVSGVVLLAVIAFRGIFPERHRWWLWLFPVIIAAAAFAIDYFIQTDAEQVEEVIYKAVKAVEKGNLEAMEPLISDDYQDSLGTSKQGLLRRCKAWFQEPIIEKNVCRIVSLDVNAPQASAVFTVRVVFDPRGPVYEYTKMMFFKIHADFQKQGDIWQFTRIEFLEPADWKSMQTSFREEID
jgi:hypothetical protein